MWTRIRNLAKTLDGYKTYATAWLTIVTAVLLIILRLLNQDVPGLDVSIPMLYAGLAGIGFRSAIEKDIRANRDLADRLRKIMLILADKQQEERNRGR